MREVNLSRLDAKARKFWWDKIQNEAPALAELFQSKQFVKLRTELNAQVIIKIDDDGNILNGEH